MQVSLSIHRLLTLFVILFKDCLLRRHCSVGYISLLSIDFFPFLLQFYRLFDVIKDYNYIIIGLIDT